MTEALRELTGRLEAAAERLRSDAVSSEDAAEVIEQCARLAGEAAAEVDRLVRATASEPAGTPPGQGELL